MPGTILIPGTVTVAAGETLFPPTMMSTVRLPFLSNFSAGFNGSGQGFDPTFLAWNGVGPGGESDGRGLSDRLMFVAVNGR